MLAPAGHDSNALRHNRDPRAITKARGYCMVWRHQVCGLSCALCRLHVLQRLPPNKGRRRSHGAILTFGTQNLAIEEAYTPNGLRRYVNSVGSCCCNSRSSTSKRRLRVVAALHHLVLRPPYFQPTIAALWVCQGNAVGSEIVSLWPGSEAGFGVIQDHEHSSLVRDSSVK